MFPSMPWQYQGQPNGGQMQPGIGLVQPGFRPDLGPPMPQSGLPEQTSLPSGVQPAPSAPAGPDQWLRTPGGTSAAAGSAPATQPSVPGASRGVGPMRPPMRPAFATPEISSTATTAVGRLIERVSQVRKLSPITVTQQNETLILRGRVATDRDRLLAESLARLEPGVWDVRNELEVAKPDSSGSTSSAGSTPR